MNGTSSGAAKNNAPITTPLIASAMPRLPGFNPPVRLILSAYIRPSPSHLLEDGGAINTAT
ncbi:hypothetical protein QP185_08610 [Sphingomonas aerolata]|uniref:hypothetical protein n=1 Tax=Sphingomonas aerolata TaxID=185951 RepID=UPI002FE31821